MKHLVLITLLIPLLDISVSVAAASGKGLTIIRRTPRPPFPPVDEDWLSKVLGKIEEMKEKEKQKMQELLDEIKKRICRNGECEWTTTTTTEAAEKGSDEKDKEKKFEDWLKGILDEKHNATRPSIPTKDEMKEKIKHILEDMKGEEQKQKQKNEGVEDEVQTMSPSWGNLESAMANSRADNTSSVKVPKEANDEGWWNSFWFWLIHVIGVLIIVVLIIIICVMCANRKKNYQRLA